MPRQTEPDPIAFSRRPSAPRPPIDLPDHAYDDETPFSPFRLFWSAALAIASATVLVAVAGDWIGWW